MSSVDNYEPYEWKDAPEYRTTPTSARNFNHLEQGVKKNNTTIKSLCTEVATKAENAQTFTQADSRANINSGETIATVFGKIKKWYTDLNASIAFINKNNSASSYLNGQGQWTTPPNTTYSNGTGLNLSNFVFSVKYGNSSGTACQGNDSRLSDARPASDVYSWAKQLSKPSYGWDEITGKPGSYTPSAHTQDWSTITGKPSTYTPSSHTQDWSTITGKPSTYPPSSHTHSYLPLSGGTLTGTLYMGGKYIENCDGYYFDNGGNMCMRKSSNWYNLENGQGGIAYKAQYHDFKNYNGGWNGVSASAFNVQSSLRYKENIEDISSEDAEKLLDVRVVKYDYKKGITSEDRHRLDQHGVIAEEVNEILPEVVTIREDKPDSVDYSKFVPYLIKMVQMQQKEIEELKRR